MKFLVFIMCLSFSLIVNSAVLKPITLIRIVDGDTIDYSVINENDIKRGRLLYVDAPESKQFYGAESSVCLNNLLKNNNLFVNEQGTDIYNRNLIEIFSNFDTESINIKLIKNGCVWCYPLNSSNKITLIELQENAKNKKLGLWGYPHINPKLWRVAKKSGYLKSNGESCDDKFISCDMKLSCSSFYYYLYSCNRTDLDINDDGIPCKCE